MMAATVLGALAVLGDQQGTRGPNARPSKQPIRKAPPPTGPTEYDTKALLAAEAKRQRKAQKALEASRRSQCRPG